MLRKNRADYSLDSVCFRSVGFPNFKCCKSKFNAKPTNLMSIFCSCVFSMSKMCLTVTTVVIKSYSAAVTHAFGVVESIIRFSHHCKTHCSPVFFLLLHPFSPARINSSGINCTLKKSTKSTNKTKML